MRHIGIRAHGALPLLAYVLVSVAACDSAENPVGAGSSTPGDTPSSPLDSRLLGDVATASGYTGIPYGPAWLWNLNGTVKWGPGPFTSSINGTDPASVVRLIGGARTQGQKLILNMVGGDHEKYKTDGKFDLTKWKTAMSAYGTDAIKSAIASAVADGTVIMTIIMDEPQITDWGGVMTKPLIDTMATFTKAMFPTLPTGVTARFDWRTEEQYRVVDAIMAQYQWNKGPVTEYRDDVLAQAQREGIAVVFSMNVIDGGIMSWKTRDCPIPLTGGFGTKVPNCRMTADQVRDWGRILGVAGCAMSMWKYDQAFMSKADNQQAFIDVAATLAGVPAPPCRRTGPAGPPPPPPPPPSNSPPSAAFAEPSCTAGTACRFTDQSEDPDGSIVERAWNFGNGETSTEANPTTTFVEPGSYSVELEVTDDGGATDAVTRSVQVVSADANLPPRADFVAPACTAGTACQFTDASQDDDGSVAARRWDFADGGTSAERDPVHTFGAAGTVDVTLTVTDDDGDSGTITRSVTVSPAPLPPPTADFAVTCSGLVCSFTDRSSDPNGRITGRSWSFGDGATSTAVSPSRTYAAAGTYQVSLTITYDGGTAQHIATVTVSAPPPPPPPPAITLTVTGRKDATKLYMALRWSGAKSSSVTVFRDGASVITTPNDGLHTDSRPRPGKSSYTYKICQPGTTICSNNATVTFP